MTNKISEITGQKVQVILLTPLNLKHIVYVFYNEEQPLYVGCSRVGLRRVFSHNKTIMVTESTKVCFVEVKTHESALKLERQLIAALAPQYNYPHHRRLSSSAPAPTVHFDITEQQWAIINKYTKTKYGQNTKYGPRTIKALDELVNMP